MRHEYDVIERCDRSHTRRRERNDRRFHGRRHAEHLVDELLHQGKRELTVIGNDTALPGIGIGKLITANAVRKVIASHIGLNRDAEKRCWQQRLKSSWYRKAR